MENTKFTSGKGTEGENILYVGDYNFWDHLNDYLDYRELGDWVDKVFSWDGGARVTEVREYPAAGLE